MIVCSQLSVTLEKFFSVDDKLYGILQGHFHMQNVSSVVRWGICQGHVQIIPKDCMLKVSVLIY